MTNYHVVDECKEIRLAKTGEVLQIVAQDPTNDLALLKSEKQKKNHAVFRDGENIRAGDSVVVIGYPLTGLLATSPIVTTGTVSALAGPGNDSRYLQITAPVQPGNSGGPLLDESGHVVGVVVGKLNALKVAKITGDIPQNVNFAISGTVVRAFLEANGFVVEAEESKEELPISELAENLRESVLLLECTD